MHFKVIARLRTDNIASSPEFLRSSLAPSEDFPARSTRAARRTLVSRRQSGRHRRQRFPVLDSLPFNDGINVVTSNILERLNITIRPAYLHRLYFRGGGQTEVQAQVIL